MSETEDKQETEEEPKTDLGDAVVEQMDFNEEMAELIESIGEPDIGKLINHKEQINKIAEYCKTTGLYQHTTKQRNDFSKDMDAVECYQQMILKIINAPVQIMVGAAAILIIPVIADKLNDPKNSE